MSKKLTKTQIKTIAYLHSAILISYVDSYMFDENCKVSENEQQLILTQIKNLAEKISCGLPMNLGGTEDIVKYVRSNVK